MFVYVVCIYDVTGYLRRLPERVLVIWVCVNIWLSPLSGDDVVIWGGKWVLGLHVVGLWHC